MGCMLGKRDNKWWSFPHFLVIETGCETFRFGLIWNITRIKRNVTRDTFKTWYILKAKRYNNVSNSGIVSGGKGVFVKPAGRPEYTGSLTRTPFLKSCQPSCLLVNKRPQGARNGKSALTQRSVPQLIAKKLQELTSPPLKTPGLLVRPSLCRRVTLQWSQQRQPHGSGFSHFRNTMRLSRGEMEGCVCPIAPPIHQSL